MRSATSHYVLFSEVTHELSDGEAATTGAGRWKFVLVAADGSSRIEAADEEQGLPPDRLELLAVVRGLEALPLPSRVTLVTNSRYVRRGVRFGLNEWRENGWQWEHFGQMSPISNADLWQRLDRAMQIHDVQCRVWRIDGPHSVSTAHAAAPKRERAGIAVRAGRLVRGFIKGAPLRAAQLL